MLRVCSACVDTDNFDDVASLEFFFWFFCWSFFTRFHVPYVHTLCAQFYANQVCVCVVSQLQTKWAKRKLKKHWSSQNELFIWQVWPRDRGERTHNVNNWQTLHLNTVKYCVLLNMKNRLCNYAIDRFDESKRLLLFYFCVLFGCKYFLGRENLLGMQNEWTNR